MEHLTLKDLDEKFGTISGDYNGKDNKFISGGEIYHEEQASIADDIVGKINDINELIELFNQ